MSVMFAETASRLLKAKMSRDEKSHKPKDKTFEQRCLFWIEFLGNIPWEEITHRNLQEGLAFLQNRGKAKVVNLKSGDKVIKTTVTYTGEEYAPATINKYLITYASLVKLAKERYLLDATHLSVTRFVQKQPENNGRHLDITKEEIETLVNVAHLARWKPLPAIIAVASSSGLRLGNLKQLRWRDVDLERGTATVWMTKNGLPHTSALSGLALKELNALKRATYKDDDLIFGKHNFTRAYQRACEDAGLDHKLTCFHLLRHACASLLAKAQVSESVAMAVMGHKTPSMTRRYTHLSNQTLVDSVARAWS